MKKMIMLAMAFFLFFGLSGIVLAGRDAPLFSASVYAEKDSGYVYFNIQDKDGIKKSLYLGQVEENCRWPEYSHETLYPGSDMGNGGRFITTERVEDWCAYPNHFTEYTVKYIGYNHQSAHAEDVFSFRLEGEEEYIGHDTFLLNEKEVLGLWYEQDYDADGPAYKVHLKLWRKGEGIVLDEERTGIPSDAFFSVDKGASVLAYKKFKKNDLKIVFITKEGKEEKIEVDVAERK